MRVFNNRVCAKEMRHIMSLFVKGVVHILFYMPSGEISMHRTCINYSGYCG